MVAKRFARRTRRVLAHEVAITLEACDAREAIEYGTPETVDTDQGSQSEVTQAAACGAA